VTASFRTSLRNGAMTLTTGSARLYDMVGQWKSFDVGFTNRDGSVGTDDILVVRDLDERSIGKPVEIRSFNTVGKSVNPATGISSIVLTVTMNDGSVYASGDEIIPIQDTILVDVGPAYTCKYSGDANNNANGLNVTMAVLGPYNAADKVEFVVRTDSGDKTVRASFRAARDAYYNVSRGSEIANLSCTTCLFPTLTRWVSPRTARRSPKPTAPLPRTPAATVSRNGESC
jgi:hypothetical protein